jgi:hypothetical protein
VGRMQLSFPGPVEVAATTFKNLRARLNPKLPGFQQAEFTDGEVAGYSPQSRYDGTIVVSLPLTAEQQRVLREDAKQTRLESARNEKIRQRQEGGAQNRLHSEKEVPATQAFVRWGQRGYGVYIPFGPYALVWASSGDIESSATTYRSLTESLRERAPFEVPTAPGVCLPFSFTPDSGQTKRDVQMTFRLVDHPDVRVMLKDASARVTEPGIRTKNSQPEPVMVGIWQQHLADNFKEVLPLWSPAVLPVKLAGYNGLASFVQLTSASNAVDYGYLAVVRGDPAAKDDSPDLMLYIIRDASKAIAKGKQPIAKDDFLQLAQAIASSVQRRPVVAKP